MDDRDLIAAVADGDHSALRELFERHAPWIAGRLRRLLPSAVVEDVLQETFIAVWKSARSYQSEGVVGAWIWGIARRQSALWARRNRRPQLGTALPAMDMDDPAAIASRKVDLEQALSTLQAEDEDLLELARLLYLEDRKVADVARILGIPNGTVKSRAFRLRRLLRSALQGEG